MLQFAAVTSFAGILAGPILNPGNGHIYYLLAPNTWTASPAEAVQLGGNLATINDQAEQNWVYQTFSTLGGTNRNLWIGLRRTAPGGPFGWASGQNVQFTNWIPGEPNNLGGVEYYVHMIRADNTLGQPAGVWNDLLDGGYPGTDLYPLFGVVEVEAVLPTTPQRAIFGMSARAASLSPSLSSQVVMEIPHCPSTRGTSLEASLVLAVMSSLLA